MIHIALAVAFVFSLAVPAVAADPAGMSWQVDVAQLRHDYEFVRECSGKQAPAFDEFWQSSREKVSIHEAEAKVRVQISSLLNTCIARVDTQLDQLYLEAARTARSQRPQ